AKWDGSTWQALGSGNTVYVDALASFDDGGGPALWMGGSVFPAGGAPISGVAKWQSGSWLDGGGADGSVQAFGAFDDGAGPSLYLGGSFLSVAGVQAGYICRRRNDQTWSALGPQSLGADASIAAELVFDDGSGPSLFVGGSFES